MANCDIQRISPHAFPRNSSSVADRRMTLEFPCHEMASFSTRMLSASFGPSRRGAPVLPFVLCENHAQLVVQIDQELIDDGWTTGFAEKPHSLI
jgi:hypothetical protein